KIFITGGTGFVGRTLVPALVQAGHEVTLLTRSGIIDEIPGVHWVIGDPIEKGGWQGPMREHDAVINLAGASVFRRWTKWGKLLIRETRLLTTRNIVEALDGGNVKAIFSASAVGYYGFHGDEALEEEAPPGRDFLAQLARDWEAEALRAEAKGCRVVLTRFGIVLGDGGGALAQMVPLFRNYLGGPLGHGNQWVSWIHIRDLSRALIFLLDRRDMSGPVNFTAPNPVRNGEWAKAIAEAVGKPCFFRAPGFMLRLLLGEFGSFLLEGQKVVPKRLLQTGFAFEYPDMDQALQNILVAKGAEEKRFAES
ncbi:MAG TPA: TIGR01777 family oxidoreductase, partial [Thermodesulfobacteriota bacterium]|nr:TIGR01777 family oxidoreductase [Thermodesulfobacteriota bacterium]